MIDEVGLVRIEVRTEPAPVSHDSSQFAHDPVRELQPVHDWWLLHLPGRHLLQGDLGPHSPPDACVDFIHRPQIMEREISRGFLQAMTAHTMAGEKWSSKAAMVLVDLLSGRVGFATCHGQQAA